jgi:hypothetical protein
MSGLSVDVNVTVWWEDVGGKDERKFIIPLACPDIRGRPRPDELLATKLKEKIPFARWLRLEVQVDNKWRLGRKDVVYDQSHDEDARPSEREVMESITRHQREILWGGDPRVSVELKILPEMPHNVGYVLDDVAMPRIPRIPTPKVHVWEEGREKKETSYHGEHGVEKWRIYSIISGLNHLLNYKRLRVEDCMAKRDGMLEAMDQLKMLTGEGMFENKEWGG